MDGRLVGFAGAAEMAGGCVVTRHLRANPSDLAGKTNDLVNVSARSLRLRDPPLPMGCVTRLLLDMNELLNHCRLPDVPEDEASC